MTRNLLYKSVLLTALTLPLAACDGGEPSEKTIKNLILETSIKEYNAMPELIKQHIPNPKDATIEKLACKELKEKSGYNCDVKVTVKNGETEQSQVSTVRFVETDDGWKILGQ